MIGNCALWLRLRYPIQSASEKCVKTHTHTPKKEVNAVNHIVLPAPRDPNRLLAVRTFFNSKGFGTIESAIRTFRVFLDALFFYLAKRYKSRIFRAYVSAPRDSCEKLSGFRVPANARAVPSTHPRRRKAKGEISSEDVRQTTRISNFGVGNMSKHVHCNCKCDDGIAS